MGIVPWVLTFILIILIVWVYRANTYYKWFDAIGTFIFGVIVCCVFQGILAVCVLNTGFFCEQENYNDTFVIVSLHGEKQNDKFVLGNTIGYYITYYKNNDGGFVQWRLAKNETFLYRNLKDGKESKVVVPMCIFTPNIWIRDPVFATPKKQRVGSFKMFVPKDIVVKDY